ncbi:MAG: hypothetical protein ACKV2O_16115 [Acidimicrobiales bacterium]
MRLVTIMALPVLGLALSTDHARAAAPTPTPTPIALDELVALPVAGWELVETSAITGADWTNAHAQRTIAELNLVEADEILDGQQGQHRTPDETELHSDRRASRTPPPGASRPWRKGPG